MNERVTKVRAAGSRGHRQAGAVDGPGLDFAKELASGTSDADPSFTPTRA